MLVAAVGTINAEPQPVHVALLHIAVCVFELAGRVSAVPRAGVVTAHWHPLLIQFVKESAGVTPHTQPFHPVRAHSLHADK